MKISLTAARNNAGLTQAQVAKALKKSVKTIDNWEKGKTQIDRENYYALCRLYKVSIDDIFLLF